MFAKQGSHCPDFANLCRIAGEVEEEEVVEGEVTASKQQGGWEVCRDRVYCPGKGAPSSTATWEVSSEGSLKTQTESSLDR